MTGAEENATADGPHMRTTVSDSKSYFLNLRLIFKDAIMLF